MALRDFCLFTFHTPLLHNNKNKDKTWIRLCFVESFNFTFFFFALKFAVNTLCAIYFKRDPFYNKETISYRKYLNLNYSVKNTLGYFLAEL